MAQCKVTLRKLDKFGIPQDIPCGKCPDCRKTRISEWSFRLMQESKDSESGTFVTLTYAPIKLPITKNGFPTLKKEDIQNFMKRLRKIEPNQRIKYYAAGEYGENFDRPHYHIIIFNVKDVYSIEQAWSYESKNDKERYSIGSIHCGNVEGPSVGYTLKYLDKDGKVPLHRNDDRQPEFQLMSKGMGLGYITGAKVAWHRADKYGRMYIPVEENLKITMPRYYKNLIYHKSERKSIGIHAQLNKEKKEQRDKQLYEMVIGLNYEHSKVAQHLAAQRKFKQKKHVKNNFNQEHAQRQELSY